MSKYNIGILGTGTVTDVFQEWGFVAEDLRRTATVMNSSWEFFSEEVKRTEPHVVVVDATA